MWVGIADSDVGELVVMNDAVVFKIVGFFWVGRSDTSDEWHGYPLIPDATDQDHAVIACWVNLSICNNVFWF